MASEIAKMVAGAKLKQVTGDIEGTICSLDVQCTYVASFPGFLFSCLITHELHCKLQCEKLADIAHLRKEEVSSFLKLHTSKFSLLLPFIAL